MFRKLRSTRKTKENDDLKDDLQTDPDATTTITKKKDKKEKRSENKDTKAKEETKDQGKPSDKWYGSPETLPSHVAALLVTILMVLIGIGLMIWTIIRAGYSESSAQQQTLAIDAGSSATYLLPVGDEATVGTSASSPSINTNKFTVVGNQMVSTGSVGVPGVTSLSVNQAIVSMDKTKMLGLDSSGNLLLLDLRNPKTPVVCWSSCTANQGVVNFVISPFGNGFLMLPDASRAVFSNSSAEDPPFWVTPNCRQNVYRRCFPGQPTRICGTDTTVTSCFQSITEGPYILYFTNYGLELVSKSPANTFSPDNLLLYPELKTNREWPVPFWRQACPLPAGASAPVCDVYVAPSSQVGDCSKCAGTVSTSATPSVVYGV